jgi:ATP-binding cassette subfamily B protein
MLICVLVLLAGQAMLELELPTYMSDIVNVGIVQEGITSAVPDVIRESTLETLLVFMDDNEAEAVRNAYEPLTDHSYTADEPILKLKGNADISSIEASLTRSSAIISLVKQLRSGSIQLPEGESSPELSMMTQLLSGDDDLVAMMGRIPTIMRPLILERINGFLSAMPEATIEQMAVLNVSAEYSAIGYPGNQTRYISMTGLKMLALVALAAICSVAVGFFSSRIAAGLGRDLRKSTFERVLSFGSQETHKFSTASLITRTTNDIQQVQQMSVMLLRILVFSPIMAIGGILKVTTTDVSMTWVIVLGVAAVIAVVGILMATTFSRFQKMQKLLDRLNLVTREILTGMPVIRAFSTQKREQERFDSANKDVTDNALFVNRAMSLMFPGMSLVMTGVMCLIIWVGSHQIAAGSMQIGDMMAFMQYAMQIIMSFLMISMLSIMLPRAVVALKRIQEILDTKPALGDPRKPKQFPKNGKGAITFSNVTFAYPDSEEAVLHDISFESKPGQVTAFIGSTGSGKSSVLNLIPRFFDVTEGSVKVDGVDVRDVPMRELRARIGYIPQKALLFSGDIESNIKFGGRDISDDAAQMAAEVAQAADFIEQKPDGMREAITQGGDNVSGGQRQRLAIARALAGNPDILIFDDSFSALDFRTDAQLRASLRANMNDKNILIVAQRIATIMNADQIIVLDDGRMIARGKHDELMKTCPVYRDIAVSQFSESEVSSL